MSFLLADWASDHSGWQVMVGMRVSKIIPAWYVSCVSIILDNPITGWASTVQFWGYKLTTNSSVSACSYIRTPDRFRVTDLDLL